MITIKLNRQEQSLLLQIIGSKCFDKKTQQEVATKLYDKIASATQANPKKQGTQGNGSQSFGGRISHELLPSGKFLTL